MHEPCARLTLWAMAPQERALTFTRDRPIDTNHVIPYPLCDGWKRHSTSRLDRRDTLHRPESVLCFHTFASPTLQRLIHTNCNGPKPLFAAAQLSHLFFLNGLHR